MRIDSAAPQCATILSYRFFPLLRKSVNAIRLSHEALTSAQAVFFQSREARALGDLGSTRLNQF